MLEARSMLSVNGIAIAIAIVGPRPGIAPITMPAVVPISKARIALKSDSMAKAVKRSAIMSPCQPMGRRLPLPEGGFSCDRDRSLFLFGIAGTAPAILVMHSDAPLRAAERRFP